MAKKQFKTESKKLLDMMVNSIYTHKEIFLRELVSNASDAIDKLAFRALTDTSIRDAQGEFEIRITPDKNARTITISDNGCGMTEAELEQNLGTIAKSGSFEFKKNLGEEHADIDVIGQFGVGFYSAFMVSDNIKVTSRAYGSDEARVWSSTGASGYTVEPGEKAMAGTEIVLHIKDDTEDEKYGIYLEEYEIRSLIKKYSDYIRYPVRMLCTKSRPKEGAEGEYESYLEDETLNSMVPIWKRPASEVSDDDYAKFYSEKFYDFEKPLKVITQRAEGRVEYQALLFVPAKAPYDYYSREYEKGLQLYSSGVMIMEKCADLLPDYFSFVKGVVDSPDLSLNISREMLQHDRQLKLIAKNLEGKISAKLSEMLEKERDNYVKFFDAFGPQIKYGIYSSYGADGDTLKDLLLFDSTCESKKATLKEYVSRLKEGQDKIYYAAGESLQQIEMLPQTAAVKDKGFEILYLTHDVDEFALQMLGQYDGKPFCNICGEALDLASEEEKEAVKKENEDSAELLSYIKEKLGGSVGNVRFTASLKDHAACISSEGMLSAAMEKTLNQMPTGEEKLKADLVLEISQSHPVAAKLKALFAEDRSLLDDYIKLLYHNARLVSGLDIEDPAEFSRLVSRLMA